MADRKPVGHAYNIDFLNVVFAASSLVLFLSVIWMVWDDYDRQWKNYQRAFGQLETAVTQASLQQASSSIDRKKLARLEAERGDARRSLVANRERVRALQGELGTLEANLYRITQDYQFAKANFDAVKYDFEAVRVKDPRAAERVADSIRRQEESVLRLNLQMEEVTATRDRKAAELGKYTGRVVDIDKQFAELTAERDRIRKRLQSLAPSLIKTFVRDAPLLDFMAPTIKIQQVITPNIVDDVNFTRVPKMDRCMTCHLAIDKAGYEKYPQPFRTHPNLNLYIGSGSPHPLEQIGCTVCHEGMGQSVSFRDAAHTPINEKQREAWVHKYEWEEPHLWDYPMLPAGMTEASCAKCHKNTVFIPGATKLNTAYAMFERGGCYACHKTRGFEGLRKPGPNLTKIDSKLAPEWVKTWIRSPRAMKPSTWMPQIWYLSNSSAPADAKRNEVEIDAIVAYLYTNSDKHEFAVASPPQGSARNGKTLVESVGCLGCHVENEGRAQAGSRRTFGQPLQNVGNKTSYVWLFNWVRDPKHYSPGTYMPDLRLTDQEAADVASHLMTLKGPAGEGRKANFTQQDAESVLMDYLTAVMPYASAKAELAKLDAGARKLEIGKRAVSRYGCFSCHEIKGFENTQPIGTELTEEGSKLVSRLDFAFVDIPHEKLAWFETKLHDPRVFDRGRELRPLERLRMPNFGLSDEEVKLFVTAIMSFQRDIQPAAALQQGSERVDAMTAGRNLVRRRNCVACHVIEGDGGDYGNLVAEPTLAPPLLTPEGAKVQHDWLYAFLRAPITIRPWLQVRMPTFGLDDPQVNQVIKYFGAVSGTMTPFRSHEAVRASSDLSGTGKQLFDLLRCQQCHVLGEIPKDQPTANLAPDLRMAPDRLQADWILEWLKNPARIQPGTRMPAFWPDYPKSYYAQFNSSAEMQIRAVRDHLLTLRGGPSPRRTPGAPAAIASPN
ncbi:MAG: c-type cytochrome [Acidobacteria bacterium]|nr:c-type cytochrome [Acidobacteriota bacterium]